MNVLATNALITAINPGLRSSSRICRRAARSSGGYARATTSRRTAAALGPRPSAGAFRPDWRSSGTSVPHRQAHRSRESVGADARPSRRHLGRRRLSPGVARRSEPGLCPSGRSNDGPVPDDGSALAVPRAWVGSPLPRSLRLANRSWLEAYGSSQRHLSEIARRAWWPARILIEANPTLGVIEHPEPRRRERRQCSCRIQSRGTRPLGPGTGWSSG
jgi:hypothetical protein